MTRAFTPTTLEEAVAALSGDTPAIPIAGCTDLLVADHAEGRKHAAVVDVLRIPEMQGIGESNGYLDFGAATTFSQLRESPLVHAHAPALVAAAATVGGWQIQNRATVGGNIANASPAGDSLPALLALDAELELAGPNGQRTVPYSAFHHGYRQTALEPGELIVRVRIPILADRVQEYVKVGTRMAQAISKVVVGFSAIRTDGVLSRVRIAAGSVAATPVRLVGAEQACEGRSPSVETADRAGGFAAAQVRPIDDVRSTAEYRKHALSRVVRRVVLNAGK